MADLPRGQRRLTPRVRGMPGAVPTQLTPTVTAPTWSAFSPGMPRDGRTTPSKTAPPSRTSCTPFRSVQRTHRCRTQTRAILQSLFGTELLNWTNLPHKTETQNGNSKYLWSSPLRAGQAEEEPWTPGPARPLLRRRQAEKGQGLLPGLPVLLPTAPSAGFSPPAWRRKCRRAVLQDNCVPSST